MEKGAKPVGAKSVVKPIGKGSAKLAAKSIGKAAPKLAKQAMGKGALKFAKKAMGKGAPKLVEKAMGKGAPTKATKAMGKGALKFGKTAKTFKRRFNKRPAAADETDDEDEDDDEDADEDEAADAGDEARPQDAPPTTEDAAEKLQLAVQLVGGDVELAKKSLNLKQSERNRFKDMIQGQATSEELKSEWSALNELGHGRNKKL